MIFVFGKSDVVEERDVTDPLLTLNNTIYFYLALQYISHLGLMSGMWRTVGRRFISELFGCWLMLDAVDRLLVKGKVLVTDWALLTD